MNITRAKKAIIEAALKRHVTELSQEEWNEVAAAFEEQAKEIADLKYDLREYQER